MLEFNLRREGPILEGDERFFFRLSEHFKSAKKDKHSSVGLTKSVNKRKKLLVYLKKKNSDSYKKVIKQLNLRK